jgi:hypothetical protein
MSGMPCGSALPTGRSGGCIQYIADRTHHLINPSDGLSVGIFKPLGPIAQTVEFSSQFGPVIRHRLSFCAQAGTGPFLLAASMNGAPQRFNRHGQPPFGPVQRSFGRSIHCLLRHICMKA